MTRSDAAPRAPTVEVVPKNGICDALSPATIVLGIDHPDCATMRIELSAHAQVFEDSDPTNTPRARFLGAIDLTPTGNAQGAFHFLSLATGARITRHCWIEVPIPDTAIIASKPSPSPTANPSDKTVA